MNIGGYHSPLFFGGFMSDQTQAVNPEKVVTEEQVQRSQTICFAIHTMVIGDMIPIDQLHSVHRVPGGWNYLYFDNGVDDNGNPIREIVSTVFVPFSEDGFPQELKTLYEAGFLDSDVKVPEIEPDA